MTRIIIPRGPSVPSLQSRTQEQPQRLQQPGVEDAHVCNEEALAPGPSPDAPQSGEGGLEIQILPEQGGAELLDVSGVRLTGVEGKVGTRLGDSQALDASASRESPPGDSPLTNEQTQVASNKSEPSEGPQAGEAEVSASIKTGGSDIDKPSDSLPDAPTRVNRPSGPDERQPGGTCGETSRSLRETPLLAAVRPASSELEVNPASTSSKDQGVAKAGPSLKPEGHPFPRDGERSSSGAQKSMDSQARGLRASVSRAKTSPPESGVSSPRDGDGYNSADEHAAGLQRIPELDDEREAQFEASMWQAKHLQLRRMAGDGNCLFRAVADQVYGDPEMHPDARHMCIDYMEKERDHFSQFVTESFTAYCKRKRRDKVFGNNLEIQAMAEIYETGLPPICLSYHRRNHYNSLVNPARPAVGAGLGFGSLRGSADSASVKAALLAQQEHQLDSALVKEGQMFSDVALTEAEVEAAVLEASRREYLGEFARRSSLLCSGEAGPSTAARGDSSSPDQGASGNRSSSRSSPQHESRGAGVGLETAPQESMTANMRSLISMGFDYLQVLEAYSMLGDNLENMLCFLLETRIGDQQSTNKGKAVER
eukprot:jgi/Mesen1/9880/ME000070S09165